MDYAAFRERSRVLLDTIYGVGVEDEVRTAANTEFATLYFQNPDHAERSIEDSAAAELHRIENDGQGEF